MHTLSFKYLYDSAHSAHSCLDIFSQLDNFGVVHLIGAPVGVTEWR